MTSVKVVREIRFRTSRNDKHGQAGMTTTSKSLRLVRSRSQLLKVLYIKRRPKNESNVMKKVLFIRTNALGDVFLTLPVIKAYMQERKETQVYVLTDPEHVILYREILPRERIISTGYPFYEKKVIDKLNRLSFSYVINLQDHFRGAFYAGLISAEKKSGLNINEQGSIETTPLSLALLDAVESRVYLRKKVHLIDVYALLAGVKVENIKGYIPLKIKNPKGRAKEEFLNTKIITLHLVCGWESRSLKGAMAETLINKISRAFPEYKVLILGQGKAEESFYSGLAIAEDNVLNYVNKLSFTETLRIISNASLFIGIDSSLMHLAFSYKIPTITMWCSTTPEGMGNKWKNGNDFEVINKGKCQPCFQKDCKKGSCFKKIKIPEIIRKAREIVKAGQSGKADFLSGRYWGKQVKAERLEGELENTLGKTGLESKAPKTIIQIATSSGCSYECSGCSKSKTYSPLDIKLLNNQLKHMNTKASTDFEISDFCFFKDLKRAKQIVRLFRKHFPGCGWMAPLLKQEMKNLSLADIQYFTSMGFKSALLRDYSTENPDISSPKCLPHVCYEMNSLSSGDEFLLLNMAKMHKPEDMIFAYSYPSLSLHERTVIDSGFYRKNLEVYKKDKIFKLLESLNRKNKTVFLYGANFIAEYILKNIKQYNNLKIKDVLDGSQSKLGKEFCGFQIKAPEVLSEKKYPVLICSLNNVKSIREFLEVNFHLNQSKEIYDFI